MSTDSLLEPAVSIAQLDLGSLLQTVFQPEPGEKICILIDLEDPMLMKDYSFVKNNPELKSQYHAYNSFYVPLRRHVLSKLGLKGGDMFAYRSTGGSNLDFLDDEVVDKDGHTKSLKADIFGGYDIILCIGTFSATAPLTAAAKIYGFRGATMHGLNEVILESGLCVDYEEVSRVAELMRKAMSGFDEAVLHFRYDRVDYSLIIGLSGQEAQKSHGLCRDGFDIANLPAGEIYFVPTDANGKFPYRFKDGTIAIMEVIAGKIVRAVHDCGNRDLVNAFNERLQEDPETGTIGELGFGTQELPVSGSDIQDEKILGTMHIATGRSDHLGGSLTPDRFAKRENATHDDILFSREKTPEVSTVDVMLIKESTRRLIIIQNEPSNWIGTVRVGQ